MTKPIIEISELNLYYGKKKALNGININFNSNEIIALIGPSGCGKSTLLRSINRMQDLIPTVTITGNILFKDKNIFSPNQDVVELRQDIGMVFQQPNPFPISIYENVVFGLRLKGINDKKTLDEIVEKSLKQAYIWEEVKDKLQDNATGLSGGQQQRICIARALAVEPKIILMDEPTSALDPISAGKIEEMILELKEKYTIIIVTHSMQQASRISDKTAFMLNGDLVEYDETKKIFLNAKDQRTEDYISGKFG